MSRIYQLLPYKRGMIVLHAGKSGSTNLKAKKGMSEIQSCISEPYVTGMTLDNSSTAGNKSGNREQFAVRHEDSLKSI